MSWMEEERDGLLVMRPERSPEGVTIAFSGRGRAPEGEPAPTAYLARRLANAVGLGAAPISWAKQVHGADAFTLRESPRAESAFCAGEYDALATDRPVAALVVQTADCVPILLSGPRRVDAANAQGVVGAAHAGWRGSARNVAGSAVAALEALGAEPAALSAWIGPSIGPCCYEVGGEVAAQFAGDFVRAGCGGEAKYRLDLRAVNVAQLASAGVPRGAISVHPACTKCGGERYASWRRDGANAGRMIALICRQAGVRSA